MKNVIEAQFGNYHVAARALRSKSVGTFVLGAAALVGGASQSNADVVCSGSLSGATVAIGSTLHLSLADGTFTINSIGVGSNMYDFTIGSRSFDTYASLNTATTGWGKTVQGFNGDSYAKPLSAGTTIDASQSFSLGGKIGNYYGTSMWLGKTAYVGLAIPADFLGGDADRAPDGTKPTVFNYGWLKLSVSADGNKITVDAFGYETTPGTAIKAGAGLASIPEPSSVALLAAGAAGLALYRRRKGLRRAA